MLGHCQKAQAPFNKHSVKISSEWKFLKHQFNLIYPYCVYFYQTFRHYLLPQAHMTSDNGGLRHLDLEFTPTSK